MLCQFFLHIHRTLEHCNRLILPLNPEKKDIVFSRIMVALVEHFIASGDLILPNSSPTDHSHYFSDCFRTLGKIDKLDSNPFLLHNLASSFTQFVLHSGNRNTLIPTDHSFLRGDAVASSEQLLEAVKKVKETHSMEKVLIAYIDWEEWVTMLRMVEQGEKSLTDLSFLQSLCFRATLLSLQTKHQHIINPPQIDQKSLANSCHLPTTVDTPLHSSAISTQMAVTSSQSSVTFVERV
ncbi:hypothetical protein BLNAU_9078 [Blattamonas nauphoetae]|uniref:Uncharacterized protein n=1 Tax=Blattamonas nauphoetae TaxID=2049346 RepID=A0ABQ9XWS0_9EUKA|nr:hypothetical protein BLNAU_9078 [Blattamonas nauphoetae]